MEYITEQLVEMSHREIMEGEPRLLHRYTLVNATAKGYVRLSQERLIATPLLEGLVASCRGEQGVTARLFALLAQWRGRAQSEQGYGPGNVVNLLRLLHGDVIGMDFSNLALRNVYLQGIAAHDANLSGSQLMQSVFQEPFAGIESVASSPDMRYMAVGTVNGEIRLWEVASRTTLLAVKAHTGPVVGLALSADGHLLASGSADGTCRLWEVTNGQNLAILKGHTSVVWTVALSADRRLLASGSGDGTVRLWDIGNLQHCVCIAILEGHTSAVRSIALSQDGRLLASGSFDGTVRLWKTSHFANEAARGEATPPVCLAILRGHTDAIRSVALTPDGRLVASGSVDQSMRLWDISTVLDALDDELSDEAAAPLAREQSPPCIAILTGHTDVIRSVALSADGRLVASGSGDKTVRLWEVATIGAHLPNSGTCIAILEGHTNAVMSMALAADGQLLVSGSTDGTVRLWGVRSGICLAILEGHTNAVMSVALAANGRMLASGGTDGKVRLWDAQSGENLVTLQGHTNMVMGVAFSGDGQWLVSGSGDGTMRLWDVGNLHNGGRCLSVLEGHTNVVRGIAWSGDGRLMASASYDGTVRLWDIRRGTNLFTLQGHTNMVMSVALSQDGRLLASGSFDETVRLWDTSTVFSRDTQAPQCLAVLRDHTAVVYGVTLSADGRWLASCSFDRTVRLWDTAVVLRYSDEHTRLGVIISEEYKGEAWSVALSADGQALASGDTEGNVHLWKTGSGQGGRREVDLFAGHTSAIWSVAIAPDGGLVASGSGDGTVRLWDGTSATLLRTLRAARPYERMDIRGLTGITEAQRASLIALGAIG